MELTVGQVVKSKAGRDKGNIMIVLEVLSEEYVLLVDGHTRTINKPKKKKIKHIQKTNQIIDGFAKDLGQEHLFNDGLIWKLIKSIGDEA